MLQAKQDRERKILRSMVGMIKGKTLEGPRICRINLTGRCNQSCEYCWYYSNMLKLRKKTLYAIHNLFKRNKDMPLEKSKEIIDDLAKMGAEEVVLSGDGEPFLHPRINDMVKYAYKKGLCISILTNGTFSKKNFKVIDKISILNIHLPGIEKSTFSRLQCKENQNLEIIKKNIMELYKLKQQGKKTPLIRLNMVINKVNYHEIEKFFEFALRFRMDYVGFKNMVSFDHVKKLKLGKKDSKRIRREMLGLLRKRKYRSIHNNMLEFLQGIWPYGMKRYGEEKIRCFIGYNSVFIELDGEVKLCPTNDFTGVGNIFKNNLKDIWFSKKAERMRRRMRTIYIKSNFGKSCKKCCFVPLRQTILDSVESIEKRLSKNIKDKKQGK